MVLTIVWLFNSFVYKDSIYLLMLRQEKGKIVVNYKKKLTVSAFHMGLQEFGVIVFNI